MCRGVGGVYTNLLTLSVPLVPLNRHKSALVIPIATAQDAAIISQPTPCKVTLSTKNVMVVKNVVQRAVRCGQIGLFIQMRKHRRIFLKRIPIARTPMTMMKITKTKTARKHHPHHHETTLMVHQHTQFVEQQTDGTGRFGQHLILRTPN